MISMFHPYVNDSARERVQEVLLGKWIGEGEVVKGFERALMERFGYRHCVTINSGTSALRLALALAGVGPGDEVITTAMTCTATNTPILEQFAKPVFADIQFYTGNIEPDDVGHRITERTKAIIAVHWAGYPCDMAELNRFGLPVIEDAAHALGATYHGIPVGSISRFTAFSFQAIKHITTGDGGMLTLLNDEDCRQARLRRWFGIDRDGRRESDEWPGYWASDQAVLGYKYQMNNIQAAIGLGNLEDIDAILNDRAMIADHYRSCLHDVPGISLFEKAQDRRSANWLFTMHVEKRADFYRMMKSKGIETGVAHIRNDLHSVFGGTRDDLPVLDDYQKTYMNIPVHNRMTWDDADYIVKCIRQGW